MSSWSILSTTMAMKTLETTQPQIELIVETTIVPTSHAQQEIFIVTKGLISQILCKLQARHFRISLSLCGQALLWKTLKGPSDDTHAFRQFFRMLPTTAFILLWSLSLFTLASLSLLYILRCFIHFDKVKGEFLHHVGVNYMFAPWISWLLLLQSCPFLNPQSVYYHVLWSVFVIPIVALDVKIYGQWFTKGKRFLSAVANPASHLSVIGNLVGAWSAAPMGWREFAICLFSLGMAHYLVLFVTLYQRLSANNNFSTMLRPVFFLFFAAPSMASLAWVSISGTFDNSSKMLFFLSIFLFVSLVARPTLFKKSMKKFTLAWWAYSFPLTVLAIASVHYATEVKNSIAHVTMLMLSVLSVIVSLSLMVFTALNSDTLLPIDDPTLVASSSAIRSQV